MPDTPKDLDAGWLVRLSFLRWLDVQNTTRHDNYRAYREYYDGDHDTQLTARQREYLQIKMGEEFNVNYCTIVVDALAERLRVVGFDAGEQEDMAAEGQTVDEDVKTQGGMMWEWWERNRMDVMQSVVHLAAVRDGDAYVLVEWDNEKGMPRFSFEPALSDGEGVDVVYSTAQRGVPEYAYKRWRIENGEGAGAVRRLNLYYPDRIEKWVSNSQSDSGIWVPYREEGEPWPIPWVGADGEPMGIPVCHFRNRDEGYDFGQSELKAVVPLQNALNKAVIDLLAAADTTGFRIFTMVGGDPSGLKVAPGSWVYSVNPDAQFGAIEGGDLTPLVALCDHFAVQVARVSRTPLSYFQITGQTPAEGSQKQQEAALVAKALDRQSTFGNAWEDAMYMARKLYNLYGEGGLDETEIIEALWDEPATRDDLEMMQVLQAKQRLGVPMEYLWREMGYDDATIEEMKTARDEAQAREANIGSALLGAFEGGGGFGQPRPGGQRFGEQ